MKKTLLATAIILLINISGIAHAGSILQANSVTAPSENGTALAVHMIDQSGLSASYTSEDTDFDTYVASTTHNNSCGDNCWANVPDVTFPINLDFSLGGMFGIESVALWNFHDAWGVKDFDVFVADNAAFMGATQVGSFVANQESNWTTVAAQVFSFDAISASYVRLTLNSNYGSTMQVAIGEVAFETVSVPAPASLVLLGLGLVGIGFSRRKKA